MDGFKIHRTAKVLTLDQIKSVARTMKLSAVRTGKIKSIDQRNAMNEYDQSLGLIARWEVGDEYYVIGRSNDQD